MKPTFTEEDGAVTATAVSVTGGGGGGVVAEVPPPPQEVSANVSNKSTVKQLMRRFISILLTEDEQNNVLGNTCVQGRPKRSAPTIATPRRLGSCACGQEKILRSVSSRGSLLRK